MPPIAMARRALLATAMAAAAPPAGAARPQRSARLAFRLQNGDYGSSGADGQTFCSLYALEAPARRVRLTWFNDRPEPWTIDAAAMALTSFATEDLAALDGSGREDQASWRTVTFGNGRKDLVVPAHGGPPGQPLLRMSDWIELPAVFRADGGPGALLLVRCFSRGRIRFSAGGAPDPAVGRPCRSAWLWGDAASAPFGAPGLQRLDLLQACYGLEYESDVPGGTVIGIGDSIMQSLRTAGSVSGFGFRACVRLSSPEHPLSYVNEGFPSRTSADFGANGLRALAALRPQAALIQAWSENDPWTREASNAAFDMARRLAAAARNVGAAPVLVTAAPVFADRPEPEGERQRSNERVRALAGSDLLLLDLDRLWRDGAGYRAGFDFGDATHPNDAAAIVAADALVPILRMVLGMRGSFCSRVR